MDSIKVAVIGCGSWGRNHARVYRELPGVTLAGVVDLDINTAKKVGELYKTEYYSNPETVVKDPDIDLLSICTPTVTHTEIALKAIKSGKHCLVEKPMTNTVQEAESLITAAKECGVCITVGFVERFNPAVQEAIRFISEGEIGEVILTRTQRVSRRPLRVGDVGVVKDLAIHDIDVVNQLFSGGAETVYAVAGSIAHSYEDYANINIGFSGNRNAFIETNWLTPRRLRALTVTGTEGVINVEYTNQLLTIEDNNGLRQPFLMYREPLMQELQSFVNSIRRGIPPDVTGEEGLRALQICEAALESSRTGEKVRLPKFINIGYLKGTGLNTVHLSAKLPKS